MTCFLISPTLSLLSLLTALLLVWKEQLWAQTLPKQDKDYLQLKKATLKCSTSLTEQTKSNPGSPWAFLSHIETEWDFNSLEVGHTKHPLHCHHRQIVNTLSAVGEKWTRDSSCGGKAPSVPGSVLPQIFCTSVQQKGGGSFSHGFIAHFMPM